MFTPSLRKTVMEESIKQTLVLGLDAREQRVSWGLITPLHMPSLLPHDLCHGQSSSCWLPAKKQQLELYMEQWTVFKSGKEYTKAVHCHPDCLTYIQNTSWEMPCWMKHKLESRLPGEISITSHVQMTPDAFWSPPNKVCHCFHCFPIFVPWSDGTECHDLSIWMLSFKPDDA